MRKWLPLIAISLGTFMLLVDVTIVNVALPDIAADLRTGLGDLQWVIDIYALALAALMLGVGSAADRFGRKRVYLIGMVLFALASLGCALADSSGALITARAIQGIGGAAMFATTIALINTAYTGKDRRDQRLRGRGRPDHRWPAHRAVRLAVDLRGEHPDQRPGVRGGAPGDPRVERPRGEARPGRRRHVHGGGLRAHVRPDPRR
jgi:hypothetical protein